MPRKTRTTAPYNREVWENRVKAAYARQLMSMYGEHGADDEYKNKCLSNPAATRKIAYYFYGTGYSREDLLTDEITTLITTLYDFLSFTRRH